MESTERAILRSVAPLAVKGERSLAVVFEPRLNALNPLRLLLAIGVIVYHSFPLTGRSAPGGDLLGSVFVDGFFAISGFLLVRSWLRRPQWWPYMRARLIRIMPAFYVCLLVTVVIFAPLSLALQQRPPSPDFIAQDWGYLHRNAFLWMNQFGISDTLDSVPFPDVWNGSLWTLAWEFICYLGVLVLGVSTLLRRDWTIPVLFFLSLVWLVVVTFHRTNYYIVNVGPRFAVMFLAGAVIHRYSHRLPAAWWLVGASLLVVIVSSLLLPDYRVIAALPLAYVCIASGALVKHPRLRFGNDLSYGTYIYAFPIQQILAVVGLHKMGVPVFFAAAVALTLPMAALSWFLVEKPAQRLNRSVFSTGPSSTSLETSVPPLTTADPIILDTPPGTLATRDCPDRD